MMGAAFCLKPEIKAAVSKAWKGDVNKVPPALVRAISATIISKTQTEPAMKPISTDEMAPAPKRPFDKIEHSVNYWLGKKTMKNRESGLSGIDKAFYEFGISFLDRPGAPEIEMDRIYGLMVDALDKKIDGEFASLPESNALRDLDDSVVQTYRRMAPAALIKDIAQMSYSAAVPLAEAEVRRHYGNGGNGLLVIPFVFYKGRSYGSGNKAHEPGNCGLHGNSHSLFTPQIADRLVEFANGIIDKYGAPDENSAFRLYWTFHGPDGKLFGTKELNVSI